MTQRRANPIENLTGCGFRFTHHLRQTNPSHNTIESTKQTYRSGLMANVRCCVHLSMSESSDSLVYDG
jgi:hypothetical protein